MAFDVSPPRDCALCPRLGGLSRREPGTLSRLRQRSGRELWGEADARLLIVGLAPGLKGANRTGRPFTGDFAGDLLYQTLAELGLARGHYERRPYYGLASHRLRDRQRGALRSAGEQAYAGGNRNLP